MLPNPWVILGVVIAFVVAVGGAYLKGDADGTRRENLAWTAKVERQKDEAAQELARQTAAVAAKDQAAAKRNLEVEHANSTLQAQLGAAQSDTARLAAELDRVRTQQPGRGRGRDCPVPGAAPPATWAAGDAAGPAAPGGSFQELDAIMADALRGARLAVGLRAWADGQVKPEEENR
jgi:hypothetical protein